MFQPALGVIGTGLKIAGNTLAPLLPLPLTRLAPAVNSGSDEFWAARAVRTSKASTRPLRSKS